MSVMRTKAFVLRYVLQSLTVLLVSTGAVLAESICDVVVKERAFDSHSLATKTKLNTSAVDDICSTRWSSNDQVKKQAASWTSNASAFSDMFKGTGNGTWDADSHTASENYDKLCVNTQRSLLYDFFARSGDVIAATAVNAWRDCVLNQAQQFGLFSKIVVTPDRSNFTVEVIYKPTGASGFKVGPYDHSGYECKVGEADAQGYDVSNNYVAMSCTPKNDNDLNVAINTDVNALIGTFEVRSKKYFELENEIDAVRRDVGDASSQIVEIKSKHFETQYLEVPIGNSDAYQIQEVVCRDASGRLGLAVGGGAFHNSGGAYSGRITESYQSQDGHAWTTGVRNTAGSGGAMVRFQAICSY